MVIWTDNALSHITEFIDEAKDDTEEMAKSYMRKLVDYVDILETMPELGKNMEYIISNYEIRQLIYKKLPEHGAKFYTSYQTLLYYLTNTQTNVFIKMLFVSKFISYRKYNYLSLLRRSFPHPWRGLPLPHPLRRRRPPTLRHAKFYPYSLQQRYRRAC